MKPYIVAITGASGIAYGMRLLRFFRENRIPTELVISDTAKIVMQEELGIDDITEILRMSFRHVLSGNTEDGSLPESSYRGSNGPPIKAFGGDKSCRSGMT